MDASDKLVTMVEVSTITRAPVDTLRHWRKLGKGPRGFKVGRRVMYRQSDVLRWLDEQEHAEDTRTGRVG